MYHLQRIKVQLWQCCCLRSIITQILNSYIQRIHLQKCDKHLLVEKMPINRVASWIRFTSHTPQQKCIHCNSVPTDKFLTFDRTKYGENTLVNQMTENDEQNIICSKCHNAIFRESLVTWLTCDKTMKKCLQ